MGIFAKVPHIRITLLNSSHDNKENKTDGGSNSVGINFIEDTAPGKWKGKGKGKSSTRKEKSSIEL